MTRSSGVNIVDSFADSMERRRSADRQVRHGHVVIDRPDEPNNLEVLMR